MGNVNRNFTEILVEIDSGAVHERLSELLAKVTQAVEKTGKVGDVTLGLKIKPNKGNSYLIEPSIKYKAPEEDLGTAVFFADSDGNLSRRDPKQGDMFALKAVTN